MKNISRVVWVVLVCGLALGCQKIDGACWSVSEDGQGTGAGGGPIVPSTGGYGAAPPEPTPEPQDATNSADPCSASSIECLVTWKNTCDTQGTNCVPTTTWYRCPCATFEEAKTSCEKAVEVGTLAVSCGPCRAVMTTSSACRKACEDKADACEAECRKLPKDDKNGRSKCWAACNNEYAECVKKCKD